MPLLTIQRRCDDCETTRSLIRELREDVHQYRRELDEFKLDFENLYDKVRTNLGKLSKRIERPESPVTDEQTVQRGMTAGEILKRRMRGA